MADGGMEGGMDAEFVLEDVEGIVKGALQATFSDVTMFESSKIAGWTNSVIDTVLKGLTALGRPFKYIVTCVIMQQNGASLHTAAGAVWDPKKDGMSNMTFNHKNINCLVTVYGLAITPSAQTTEV